METFLTIVAVIFLIQFVFRGIFKGSVHQINISFYGLNKIPKALLELANINKDHATSYSDLTKEEQGKFDKIHEKVHDAVWCTLTYMDSHDLIHVQKPKGSYLHKVSDDDRYLIREEFGELKDGKELYYILYRKNNGWLRGSMLIGYLLKQERLREKEKVIPLFKFPERLMKWRYFTKGLQKQYNLKEDTIADYISEDELGYSRGIYMVSYETQNKEGANFWFRVY